MPMSEPSPIVLVVDDEVQIRRFLRTGFELNGFVVHEAGTGAEAIRSATLRPIDLVIVDLGLPDMDGAEVVERIRSWSSVPIIVLSVRSNEAQKVHLLELGADDYVVKPFSVRELLLRIEAILRRARGEQGAASTIEFGLLRLDPGAHRAWVAGTEIELTALELKLLVTLFERRNRVQNRSTLLDDVWGLESNVTVRTVDTRVKRLREKLGPAGAYIETVRGVGYRFVDSAEEANP
jgi:DNA-binding response OmpR family regulator